MLRLQISDKHGATIVSTAQSFNTTNATDRMLPNILRMFARFERELTAERIAANLKVAQDIRAHAWCNRTRTTEAGRSLVGRLHDKSSAHQILHCRTYLDVLKHRDQYFEGTHAPIIDRPPMGRGVRIADALPPASSRFVDMTPAGAWLQATTRCRTAALCATNIGSKERGPDGSPDTAQTGRQLSHRVSATPAPAMPAVQVCLPEPKSFLGTPSHLQSRRKVDMNLTANTILITGGAAGIGLALARQLSERGNRVIICGRKQDALLKAQAEVPAVIPHVCDITDAASRQAMVNWLTATHPDLNIVINNAGVQYRRTFGEEGALENLEQEVATNFTAPVRLIYELLPMLKRQSRAVIVNVSSALAFSPLAGVPVYCATKAAMHSFTLSLRHQLKATGIRVVEIAPPIVDTGLGGEGRIASTSTQAMMTPDDFVAEALAELENDQDEVMIGLAAGARKMGEALFGRMNGS